MTVSPVHQIAFALQSHQHPGARRRARPAARRPRIRPDLHRSHGDGPLVAGAGLARWPARALRADSAGPGDLGPALRAGDLRGAEGLPPGKRGHRGLPPGRERGQVRQVSGPDGDAGAARGGLHPGHRGARGPGSRLGARRPRGQPLPAAIHDRDAALPGGEPPVADVPVRFDRLAGRLVLRRGPAAGLGLAGAGLHPRGDRRHRGGESGRQLRRRLRGAAAGPGKRLRPGGLAGRHGASLGGGNGRDEPVLRLWRGRARGSPRPR